MDSGCWLALKQMTRLFVLLFSQAKRLDTRGSTQPDRLGEISRANLTSGLDQLDKELPARDPPQPAPEGLDQ